MVLPLLLPLELYFRTKETEEALDTDNTYLQNVSTTRKHFYKKQTDKPR